MSDFLMARGPLLLGTLIVLAVFGRLGFEIFKVLREHSKRERRINEFFAREKRAERFRMLANEGHADTDRRRSYLS